jgi:hypothetical protein
MVKEERRDAMGYERTDQGVGGLYVYGLRRADIKGRS